jgi:hypothetical protein
LMRVRTKLKSPNIQEKGFNCGINSQLPSIPFSVKICSLSIP